MTLALLVLAFAGLAAGTHRQAERLGVARRHRGPLKGIGATVLGVSLAIAGGGAALVEWVGLATLAALLVTLCIPALPRHKLR